MAIDGTNHDFITSGHQYLVERLAVAVGITGSDATGAAFQGYVDNVLVTPAPP